MHAAVDHGVDVTEVYSPERVTAMARQMGMKGGWAFGLTTHDERGVPWDLSDPKTQERVMKRCAAEDPYVLIGSPPCTEFSRVQFYNINKGDPREKERRLEQAKAHIRFCIKLCRDQMEKGEDTLCTNTPTQLTLGRWKRSRNCSRSRR